MTRWERLRLIVKVVEVRLRFVAVIAVTAAVIGNWDTIETRWQKWSRTPTAAARASSDLESFCPMHPSVVRPALEASGQVPKCPICGMPLSARRKSVGAAPGEGSATRVQLSPERIALARTRTEVVGFRPLEQVIETSGSVQYDESRLSRIVARVNGYVERLLVDKTFVEVKAGEPLAELYSPELYTAVRELLLTRGDAREPMAVASRERLRLLGISDEEIDGVVQKGSSDYRLVIRAPTSGHVVRRDIVRGSSVTVGGTLFEVADLSKVWIEADVFERDIPLLRTGGAIEAWVEAVPNRSFTGTIGLVHPHVGALTRTKTVRFTVDNPEHALSPGMFATVRIKTPVVQLMPWSAAGADSGIVSSGSVLALPERSVIDTGAKKVVYVEREPGLFEARAVEVGARAGDWYPAFAGVRAGERVASAGAFLVDAETRLNPAAASTFTGASGGPRAAGSSGGGSSPESAGAPAPGVPPVPGASPVPGVARPTGASPVPGVARPTGASPVPEPAIDSSSWNKLSPEDRALALEQRRCPVSHDLLGGMGTPFKATVGGKTVFLCCPSCKPRLEPAPDERGGR